MLFDGTLDKPYKHIIMLLDFPGKHQFFFSGHIHYFSSSLIYIFSQIYHIKVIFNKARRDVNNGDNLFSPLSALKNALKLFMHLLALSYLN